MWLALFAARWLSHWGASLDHHLESEAFIKRELASLPADKRVDREAWLRSHTSYVDKGVKKHLKAVRRARDRKRPFIYRLIEWCTATALYSLILMLVVICVREILKPQ